MRLFTNIFINFDCLLLLFMHNENKYFEPQYIFKIFTKHPLLVLLVRYYLEKSVFGINDPVSPPLWVASSVVIIIRHRTPEDAYHIGDETLGSFDKKQIMPSCLENLELTTINYRSLLSTN